jgi:hypothetical protein
MQLNPLRALFEKLIYVPLGNTFSPFYKPEVDYHVLKSPHSVIILWLIYDCRPEGLLGFQIDVAYD